MRARAAHPPRPGARRAARRVRAGLRALRSAAALSAALSLCAAAATGGAAAEGAAGPLPFAGPSETRRLGPLSCRAAPPPLAAACYGAAVRRYGHDVLGPTPEWSRIVVQLADGRSATADLPAPAVFEDLAPRALPLPGGRMALVAVESAPGIGARLALWELREAPNGAPRLQRLTAAPPIGRGFRWLAPAAWADLDGDGAVELAWVETPHLRGILRIARLHLDGAAARLEEIAATPGFSNHRIGAAHIDGAVADCGRGPEILLPDLARRRARAVRLAPTGPEIRDLGPFNAGERITCD